MMKKALETHEVEKLLRAGTKDAPGPPENLLILIKEEIPETLALEDPAGRRLIPPARRWYLAAASIFLAVVGAMVVYRVRESSPRVESVEAVSVSEPVEEEAGASRNGGGAAEVEGDLSRVPSLDRRKMDRLSLEQEARQNELSESRRSPEVPEQAARRNQSLRGPSAEVRVEKAPVQKPTRHERTEVASNLPESPGLPETDTVFGIPEDPAPTAVRPPPVPMASTVRPQLEAKAGEVSTFKGGAPKKLLETARHAQSAREEMARMKRAPMVSSSTGGTTDPNEQAYGDMFFRSAGVNPFVDTEVDSQSTFGLDVDTGSYTMARSYLQRGHLPPSEAIRVEEFINYFDYRDRPPRESDFSITAEGSKSPFSEGSSYHVLRFGLHGRLIDVEDRKPAALTFVIDVSGSMARENRLGLVKQSLRLLLDELQPADRVGLVVYGSRGEVILEPTGDHEAILRAIDRLVPSGSTNAEEGLILGYEMAREHFRRHAINRVILCSDGVANMGQTGFTSILERIGREAVARIELTTVGFGMGNYNDVLMEGLADRGNGRYAYVDTLAEARRLFVEELSGTLLTIASDAKVQVEFDPQAVELYRLLGYENRDIADHRFRDDTVDAGEIGAGHSVTALYEVKLAEGVRPRDTIATLHLRYRSKQTGRVEETSVRVTARDVEDDWRQTSPSLKLASLVAEFAEILKGSYWARGGDLEDVFRRAQKLSPEFSGDPEVAEFVSLVGKAVKLSVEADPGWRDE